jgi:hypothetical protein
MSGLKSEVQSVLDQETNKINNECRLKQAEIAQKFQLVKRLSTEHIAKGNKYDVSEREQQMDDLLITEYERNSELFEQSVRTAN